MANQAHDGVREVPDATRQASPLRPVITRAAVAAGLAAAQTWTLRAGVFLLPLAYSPLTYDGYVLPKLLLARLVVIVLLVVWLARMGVTRQLTLKRTPIDIPLLAFLGSALLSSAFAANLNVALFGTYGRYDGLLTLLTYAALFWLCVQTITDDADARNLMRVLIASGYVVAAVAIIQLLHDTVDQAPFPRAYGTMGNANLLGAFLTLVIALSAGELPAAGSRARSILLLNVMVVAGLALVLTFSRSGWFGAGAALLLIAFYQRRRLPKPALIVSLLAVLSVGLITAPGAVGLVSRVATTLDSVRLRLGIWTDSLHLIASRPLIGYGPDNVGLVYPRFQTVNVGLPIDKAHAEILQVAATQGVIGLAAYLVLLAAFATAFFRGPKSDAAVAAAGAWLGYELVVQFNFTALAPALPFWIFAAAAMTSWGAVRRRDIVFRRGISIAVAPGIVVAAILTLYGVVFPYLADMRLREAVVADYGGRPHEAQPLAAQARQLAPQESVNAVEVGNIAFELGEWPAARVAYQDAARLGTYNALVYRNLALADVNLGLRSEAHVAALKAVELDRWDPANQALLAQFNGPQP